MDRKAKVKEEEGDVERRGSKGRKETLCQKNFSWCNYFQTECKLLPKRCNLNGSKCIHNQAPCAKNNALLQWIGTIFRKQS